MAAIVATLLAHQRRGEVINRLAPAGGPSAWKLYGRRRGHAPMKYIATVDGQRLRRSTSSGPARSRSTARCERVDLRPIDGAPLLARSSTTRSYEVYVERREGTYYIIIEGDRYAVEVEDARLKQLKAMSRHEHEAHGAVTVAGADAGPGGPGVGGSRRGTSLEGQGVPSSRR